LKIFRKKEVSNINFEKNNAVGGNQALKTYVKKSNPLKKISFEKIKENLGAPAGAPRKKEKRFFHYKKKKVDPSQKKF